MALLPRIRPVAFAAALAVAAPAAALQTLGVIAVADPPGGPDAELAELAHQLRAACRDRAGGVEDAAATRERLVGQRSSTTLAELERAHDGALAAFRAGQFGDAIRRLQAIVGELERLPETDASYASWVRAQLRLAQAALTVGREREADEAMSVLARTDPSIEPEPDQYSPSYRRRFEQAKAKARALPMRRLRVSVEGPPGTVFLNGRAMGAAPLALWLPAGVYRVGGSSGALRVPSAPVDLQAEDGAAILDFALAESLRPPAGPGLALAPGRRDAGIVRAGTWLGVDRVVAVSWLTDGDARLLLGSIHDVREGALLRAGSVRAVAGGVPAARLGALAAFLLTGQATGDVKDRTPAAPGRAGAAGADPSPGVLATTARSAARVEAERVRGSLALAPMGIASPLDPAGDGARSADRRRWMRPAAYGSAVLVGIFTGLAIHQGLAARSASGEADDMIAPDGVLAAGSDPTRYQDLRAEARSASRNAYVSGGAAVVFALTAGVLGWKSRLPDPGPSLALRF